MAKIAHQAEDHIDISGAKAKCWRNDACAIESHCEAMLYNCTVDFQTNLILVLWLRHSNTSDNI